MASRNILQQLLFCFLINSINVVINGCAFLKIFNKYIHQTRVKSSYQMQNHSQMLSIQVTVVCHLVYTCKAKLLVLSCVRLTRPEVLHIQGKKHMSLTLDYDTSPATEQWILKVNYILQFLASTAFSYPSCHCFLQT